MSAKQVEDLCPICSKPGLTTCRNCQKTSYCSKGHCRLHWKLHKSDCFPIVQQYDDILHSRLIATRNIKAGEVILRESPLFYGPSVTRFWNENETDRKKPFCLGCFHIVTSEYVCPSCGWAACGPSCIDSLHAEQECKILTCFLKFGAKLKHYSIITVLRGVLLKGNHEIKWNKILRLDEMRNVDNCNNNFANHFGQFCSEYLKCLNLSNVTNEDVLTVGRVVCSRQFVYGGTEASGNLEETVEESSGCCSRSFIYYTASQATKSCIPNSSWTIQPETNEIHLRALVPIQFGRTISLSYSNFPQSVISSQFPSESSHVSSCCECERCRDPTVLGTFFSQFVCPNCIQMEEKTFTSSWLCPTQLEDIKGRKQIKNLIYVCHACGKKKSSEILQQLEIAVKDEVDNVLNNQCNNNRAKIIQLEILCKKHRLLHSTHYLMYFVESKILEILSETFSKYFSTFQDIEWVSAAEKYMELCKKWLEVLDVLSPGLSRERGKLLYYYQQALTVHLLIFISKRMRRTAAEIIEDNDFFQTERTFIERQFMKIISIRKTVVEIFCYDKDKTIGKNWAKEMTQKCPTIEVLKQCVFS